MLELFNKILKDGLTPNRLLILFGIKNSINFPVENINEEVEKLYFLKFIEKPEDMSKCCFKWNKNKDIHIKQTKLIEKVNNLENKIINKKVDKKGFCYLT